MHVRRQTFLECYAFLTYLNTSILGKAYSVLIAIFDLY